jgi:hypothetical protein
VVERNLAKVEVASSTLVSRSSFERRRDKGYRFKFMAFPLSTILSPLYFTFRRRSQVVRQRSAKPLFIGSIPIAASNFSFSLCNQHLKQNRPPAGSLLVRGISLSDLKARQDRLSIRPQTET